MPEKDEPKGISRFLDLGRKQRGKISKSMSRKINLSPRQERIAKVGLLFSLSLLLALILSPRISEPMRKYRVGDIAQENVKAIGEFLVEDVETTARKQQELIRRMPPVFDLQSQLGDQVQQRFQKAMAYMREVSQEAVAPPETSPPAKVEPNEAVNAKAQTKPTNKPNAEVKAELKAKANGQSKAEAKSKPSSEIRASYKVLLAHKPEFDRILGVTIPEPTFHLLAKDRFSPYLEAMVSQVLGQFFNQGVISGRSVLQPEPHEILLRRLPSRKETLEHPPYSLIELDEGRKATVRYCREMAVGVSPALRWLVCD
ncbi:MAG TPA: hypothetical protein VE082_08955, partial [Desulfobaccales bacterium]|nr:hypothetical protein [Desulfobaccales bacterium]